MKVIKEIDNDGLLLCKLQARTFELSAQKITSSSRIFIRRFMNSTIATEFDSTAILNYPFGEEDVIKSIEEEYGKTNYGTDKYSTEVLYWIGYIYRYFSYTFDISSKIAYKLVKPIELKEVFLPYHTLDPSQAIERILEAKHLLLSDEEEIQRQLNIMKKVRNIQ